MKIDGFQDFERLQGLRRGRTAEKAPSPSTVNALDRFQARLQSLGGENRGQIDELTAQIRERLGEIAGERRQPLGRSVEHQLKQLIIHAFRFFAGARADAAPAEPEPTVGLPEQPDEVLTAEGANDTGSTVVALDRSV